MALNTCPFCEHRNPADSKFCSQCGGCLHLVPCPRCGAVSDVKASTCYQCRAELPGRNTDTIEPPSPAAETAAPLPHRHSGLIVGVAVLAAIIALVYYGYRQRSFIDAPQPSVANSEPRDGGSPASAGVIRRDAAAVGRPATKTNGSSPATSPPATPLAAPTPAAANEPLAGRQPIDSRKAKAVVAPVARVPANKGDSASEPRPSEACTQAAATLGLCTTKTAQKKDPETAAANKTAIVRPQAIDAGKAGKMEPPRQGACTEAATALGLCAPTPTVPPVTHTQRKE